MKIEGFPQMLQYDTAGQRLWAHLFKGGDESSPKTATTPTVTLYKPGGESLVAAASLTQDGTTAWWYEDYDLSSLGWDKGLDYRALVTWTTSDDLVNNINMRFDVVTSAFSEPIIASTDVDKSRPTWSGVRPEDWGDWSEPIKAAHRELMWKLRRMTVEGELVRPDLLLNRDQLFDLELAFVLRNIVDGVTRLDENRENYNEEALAAWASFMGGPFAYDKDDDQVIDPTEDDVAFSGPKFGR